MKKRIPIKTCMWNSNITAKILFAKMPYILERFDFIESENPKYIIFSKKEHIANIPKSCVKIYMPIEHKQPGLDFCDWSLTFHYDNVVRDPRHLRFPNYTRVGAGKDLIKVNYDPEKVLASKTKFCAFVYSHSTPFRDSFCKKLSVKKRVDCPGIVLNNMPFLGNHTNAAQLRQHLIADVYQKYEEKVNFLKDYKFTICFENEPSDCYTSEKIYHSMLASSIPIYWGNTNVHKDFNQDSFVSLPKFKSVDAAIDHVLYLDAHKNAYLDVLAKPWYVQNKLTPYVDPKVFIDHFEKIFAA